ncbi:hypothetical protein ACHWQZ_G004787 [Mnemiopsis leidyi]
MLSLFYLPSLLYNIVYNYLNRPHNEEKSQKHWKGIQSKYSSDNAEKSKSDLKKDPENSGINKIQSVQVETNRSPALQTRHPIVGNSSKDDRSQLPSDEDLIVLSDHFPTLPFPEIPPSTSSTTQNIPSLPPLTNFTPDIDSNVINQSLSPRKPDVIVALSASDSDSEFEEFLAPRKSVKFDVNVVPASVPTSFHPDTEQAQPIIDNCHVIIEDDDDDEEDDNFPQISQNIPVPHIVPNSFAYVSQSAQPPGNRSSDGCSSSSPDVELPSYNGELEQNDEPVNSPMSGVGSAAEKFVKFEDECKSVNSSVNISGNAAAASSGGSEVWGDVPVETSSLSSQKHGEIKKYVPKHRQKRKRSDPEWNQYMEKCMLSGARGKILNSFRQCYREAFDAYRLCCDMLITFGITHASGRTVFQRAALDEIRLWKQDTVAPRPSISNQLKALDVSYLCNSSLFPTIRDVFELEKVSSQEAVMFVQDKLDHKRTKYLKHMALIITELKLQEYFDTAEMLLPLLGMDKLMTIEAYLCDKSLAATFVKTLDDLLEPSGEKISALLDHLHTEFDYNIETAQFKFTPDQITTLIKRMLKLYGLEGSAAPNLALGKTISNLKSILFCRYRKGASEDWTNTLVTTVQNSEVLQHALFTELVMYRDLEYAALLYQHIQPKLNILPEELRRYISTANLPSVKQHIREPETSSSIVQPAQTNVSTSKTFIRVEVIPADPFISDEFVSLPPNISIFDVTCPADLQLCQEALSCVTAIGFDSEWRALLDPTQPTPVALVQLSSHNACYLLDLPSIIETCNDDVLSRFVDNVFTEDVVLVGYSVLQDFKKLSETCSILGDMIASHGRVVDLAVAHKHLTRAERIKRSHEIREMVSEGKQLPQTDTVSKETGLARLCEMTFSRPLDKTCQISDWTRRPLYPEQRHYAALDAYILLPLYYKLSQTFHPIRLQDLTLEVSDVPEECKVVSYISAFTQPTPSHQLRVIVDVPCQGLGKKLRHLGVDCVILEDSQSIDDAAKISLAEGRIILSRDRNCDKLVKLTDPGRVYKVLGSNATEQLAEIRQHFNLVVEEVDLFSRCAICNCPYFLRLQPGEAKVLKAAQELCNSSTVEQLYDVYDRRQNLVETVAVTSDGVTQYGVRLQLDKVQMKKFTETKVFWGCSDCGKMYWDGCHIRNFKEKHNL